MEKREIFDKVQGICRDVFENEELVLTEISTAKDVEGWDSLTHLSLISEVETAFEIEFTLDEVKNSKNIGELLNAIIKHLSEKG